MATSNIDWLRNPDGSKGHVLNPIFGCRHVSRGCDRCYAETMAWRLAGMGIHEYGGVVHQTGPKQRKWNGSVAFNPDALREYNRVRVGPDRRKRRSVFIGSMCDPFRGAVPTDWLVRLFGRVLGRLSDDQFLVLTKRPARMVRLFKSPSFLLACGAAAGLPIPGKRPKRWLNLTLGFSAENQRYFNKRRRAMQPLIDAGWHTCVSLEPLLGPVEGVCRSSATGKRRIGWVIVGGETGKEPRRMDPDWARAIVHECCAAGVPCFVKHNQRPADLRCEQWPWWFGPHLQTSKRRNVETSKPASVKSTASVD